MQTSETRTGANADSNLLGDKLLVISGDGTICDVLQDSTDASADSTTDLAGLTVESFGVEGLAECVLENVRQTLESGQAHSGEFESGDSHFELIYVGQGRDRVLVVVRNLSERELPVPRVRHLAYVDEPTGLPNREFLLAELGRITDDLRLKDGRGAVICFDIDMLDPPGDAADSGLQDDILRVLAARLINALRDVNQVTDGDADRYSIAARIDFRKLAVVLPQIAGGSDAAAVAQRLADSMQQPIKIENKELGVAVNAGIAVFPQDGVDAVTLFESSYVAMEDAASSQSQPHRIHAGTARVRAPQRHEMELELRSALRQEELELRYLPIVTSASRDTVSVEVLFRWPQTAFGAQSIKKIVSLAEHTGLIGPIGDWIMGQACEQLRHWHGAGYSDLRLAVNLSVQEFSRRDLARWILDTLGDHSIAPEFLDLEITEHMLFRDAMRNFATCRQLKELGIGVIVDDYGTGVCTMANLAHSPVDAIKIDNSFVANSAVDDRDRAACAAATAMAHEFGMRVIAEGVETDSQANMLQAQGCDYLQGFLFCRPSPAHEFELYLAAATENQDDSAGKRNE